MIIMLCVYSIMYTVLFRLLLVAFTLLTDIHSSYYKIQDNFVYIVSMLY